MSDAVLIPQPDGNLFLLTQGVRLCLRHPYLLPA
jgi:hypothetical protein